MTFCYPSGDKQPKNPDVVIRILRSPDNSYTGTARTVLYDRPMLDNSTVYRYRYVPVPVVYQHALEKQCFLLVKGASINSSTLYKLVSLF